MNRCCNQLLVKNLNVLHNLNAVINSSRLMSNFVQYPFLNKQKMLLCPHKSSNYTQNRNLARDPPRKQNKNLSQKFFKNETSKKKKQPSQDSKLTNQDIFKPLEVKPLTNIDENIGLELGGKLEKCKFIFFLKTLNFFSNFIF